MVCALWMVDDLRVCDVAAMPGWRQRRGRLLPAERHAAADRVAAREPCAQAPASLLGGKRKSRPSIPPGRDLEPPVPPKTDVAFVARFATPRYPHERVEPLRAGQRAALTRRAPC